FTLAGCVKVEGNDDVGVIDRADVKLGALRTDGRQTGPAVAGTLAAQPPNKLAGRPGGGIGSSACGDIAGVGAASAAIGKDKVGREIKADDRCRCSVIRKGG